MKLHLNLSRKQAMYLTGYALFIMAIASIWAYGIVFTSIYSPDNLIQTAMNIEANMIKFQSGNAAWVLVLLTDLAVSWGLYIVLIKKHSVLALSTMILRLLYTVFLGIGIVFLFNENLVDFLLWWHMGLIVFGFHLILLGIIRFVKSSNAASSQIVNIPWWISALLIIAGIGYLTVHFMNSFMPESIALAKTIESYFMIPMSISELLLAGWLLVKGRKLPTIDQGDV